MAEKMTSKGLVVGLIVDQKKTNKRNKPKGEDKTTNDSSEQKDSNEQAEE